MANMGKVFEGEFRKSLADLADRMNGFPMRLYDGQGKAADSPVLADFMMFTENRAYAFECKETQERSWPFRQLREGQREALRRFTATSERNRAYVAINYRRPGTLNEMFLVPVNLLLKHVEESNRASLTRDAASLIGIRCERVGKQWALPDLEDWE